MRTTTGDKKKQGLHASKSSTMYIYETDRKIRASVPQIRLAIVVALISAIPAGLLGQTVKPELKSGVIIGTAVDANGHPVANAAVELRNIQSGDRRATTTAESGFFEFRDVQPGLPHE